MEEVRQKNLVFQTTQYYNLTIRSLFINAPDDSRKFWFAKPILTHQVPVLPSYRNQSTDLHSKSIDRFPYEGNTGT